MSEFFLDGYHNLDSDVTAVLSRSVSIEVLFPGSAGFVPTHGFMSAGDIVTEGSDIVFLTLTQQNSHPVWRVSSDTMAYLRSNGYVIAG